MDRWFDFGEDARLDLVDRRDGVPFTRLTLRDEQSSATIEGAVAAGWNRAREPARVRSLRQSR